MDSNNVVIYHKDCFDGFCSAYLIWKYIDQNAKFLPYAYQTLLEINDIKGKDVVIADFSFKKEAMARLIDEAKTILVLDHHKTAEEELKDFKDDEKTQIIFDMDRSGAGLVWDYLIYPSTKVAVRHPVVEIIEDRDLWQFKLSHTKQAMAYISTVPFTFEAYNWLFKLNETQLADLGEGILRYIDNYGELATRQAFLGTIGNYTVPIMNISYQNCSDHLNYMIEKLEKVDFVTNEGNTYPFVASFYIDKDRKYRFSLRSKGDFDVSEVAKQYGGGGHRNAAGFTTGNFDQFTIPLISADEV